MEVSVGATVGFSLGLVALAAAPTRLHNTTSLYAGMLVGCAAGACYAGLSFGQAVARSVALFSLAVAVVFAIAIAIHGLPSDLSARTLLPRILRVFHATMKLFLRVRYLHLVPHLWIPPSATHIINERGLSLDLHRPSGEAKELLPVVVFVYGGAWGSGSRAQYAKACGTLAEKCGALVCVGDYRLSPHAHCADMVSDVRDALVWTLEHCASWGGDPSRVCVVGHSAGAHLIALTLLRCASLFRERICKVVLLAGVYDIDSHYAYERSWGVEFISPMAPAMRVDGFAENSPLTQVERLASGVSLCRGTVLVVHGDQDDVVPVSASLTFASALERAGQPTECVVLPGVAHAAFVTDLMAGTKALRSLGGHASLLERIVEWVRIRDV